MNRKYLAITIVILAAIAFVTCAVADAMAYNSDEPYILFKVDGEYYAEMNVSDLSEDTIPDPPYKEGSTFICWMDAWNQPVYDLLTYNYHEGGNLLWAYFGESPDSIDPDDDRIHVLVALVVMFIALAIMTVIALGFKKYL